jgi:hypothetical protein
VLRRQRSTDPSIRVCGYRRVPAVDEAIESAVLRCPSVLRGPDDTGALARHLCDGLRGVESRFMGRQRVRVLLAMGSDGRPSQVILANIRTGASSGGGGTSPWSPEVAVRVPRVVKVRHSSLITFGQGPRWAGRADTYVNDRLSDAERLARLMLISLLPHGC